MRRGFVGLSGMVQTALQENPFSGQVYIFRGRRGDLIKVLWFDGDGLCLFSKRLERGKFLWPQAIEWDSVFNAGAAFDVARRDRLAEASAHTGSTAGGVNSAMQS